MSRKPTATQIADLLDIIRHGKSSSDGTRSPANLAQIKRNVEANEELNAEDRAMLLDEIHVALRRTDKRLANKIYGPQEDKAKQKLSQIYSDLSKKYDFSANTVGNGVKIGGDMIAGRVDVDVYFSYKNDAKWHCTFAWIQELDDPDAYFKVAIYQHSREDASLVDTCFPLHEEDKAVALYQQHLERLLVM